LSIAAVLLIGNGWFAYTDGDVRLMQPRRKLRRIALDDATN
jgi:hypothetical protein